MEIYKVGDILPDICCKGHSWEILDITQFSYWGLCMNSSCPKACGCGIEDCWCVWDKISAIEHYLFIELIQDYKRV